MKNNTDYPSSRANMATKAVIGQHITWRWRHVVAQFAPLLLMRRWLLFARRKPSVGDVTLCPISHPTQWPTPEIYTPPRDAVQSGIARELRCSPDRATAHRIKGGRSRHVCALYRISFEVAANSDRLRRPARAGANCRPGPRTSRSDDIFVSSCDNLSCSLKFSTRHLRRPALESAKWVGRRGWFVHRGWPLEFAPFSDAIIKCRALRKVSTRNARPRTAVAYINDCCN